MIRRIAPFSVVFALAWNGLMLGMFLLAGGCGGAVVEERSAAYTSSCYTYSTGQTDCEYRPAIAPYGTECPIRFLDFASSPVWVQAWCPSTVQAGHVEMCAFAGGTWEGINNSWCDLLAVGGRVPDLGTLNYTNAGAGWPYWQLSSLMLDCDYLGNGVQQVVLCTDPGYGGVCRFFGRDGDAGLKGCHQYDIRKYTVDYLGKPLPHMSIAVQ